MTNIRHGPCVADLTRPDGQAPIHQVINTMIQQWQWRELIVK
jgi:hypothetical protein